MVVSKVFVLFIFKFKLASLAALRVLLTRRGSLRTILEVVLLSLRSDLSLPEWDESLAGV